MTSILTPSVDIFLKPYKIAAKTISKNMNIKLTKAQQMIADCQGFEDWQKFNYFFQSLSELDVGFEEDEWFFFLDSTNGYIFDLLNPNISMIIANLYDSDIYDHTGARHFKELSKHNEETGDYTPSPKLKVFIDKFISLNKKQLQAAMAVSQMYWRRPYFPADTIMPELIEAISNSSSWI